MRVKHNAGKSVRLAEAGGSAAEAGQSLVLLVTSVFVLMAIAALAVDFGIAHLERTVQADALQQAESLCMQPACSLAVKNADHPGRYLCGELIANLREAGFAGEIDAYYYEPSQAESGLGADKRVYVFGATISSQTPTLFGLAFGMTSVATATRSWAYGHAYAAQKVYRPPNLRNGVMHVDAGKPASSAAWSDVARLDEETMPGGRAELDRAIARARSE